jgi:hypothetical protein
MGSARGVSGVSMNTSLMEQVPPHFMGRVQNTFNFFGTFLQIGLGLTVGWIASRVSLAAGFGAIAAVYAIAFGSVLADSCAARCGCRGGVTLGGSLVP